MLREFIQVLLLIGGTIITAIILVYREMFVKCFLFNDHDYESKGVYSAGSRYYHEKLLCKRCGQCIGQPRRQDQRELQPDDPSSIIITSKYEPLKGFIRNQTRFFSEH